MKKNSELEEKRIQIAKLNNLNPEEVRIWVDGKGLYYDWTQELKENEPKD